MKPTLLAAAAALIATQLMAEDSMTQETDVLSTINTMTDAFAAGDIDRVMTTYAPEAVVIGQPGVPVTGDAALREMFAQFVAAGVNFTYGDHEVVVAGDTALHLMQWTAPGPEGEMTALSVAVLRRQADGAWRMVIDHPFGDAVMAR